MEDEEEKTIREYHDDLFMFDLGFSSTSAHGIYTHDWLSREIKFEFDIDKKYSKSDLMKVVFDRVIEVGKEKKLKEFRSWIGIPDKIPHHRC